MISSCIRSAQRFQKQQWNHRQVHTRQSLVCRGAAQEVPARTRAQALQGHVVGATASILRLHMHACTTWSSGGCWVAGVLQLPIQKWAGGNVCSGLSSSEGIRMGGGTVVCSAAGHFLLKIQHIRAQSRERPLHLLAATDATMTLLQAACPAYSPWEGPPPLCMDRRR
jgi:hypothetical protein